MKTLRQIRLSRTLLLLAAAGAFASAAQAATDSSQQAGAKTPPPKVTTETSYIGPATEQVVVTEKYKDGTVIRVVQIIHKDGTAETRGERHLTKT